MMYSVAHKQIQHVFPGDRIVRPGGKALEVVRVHHVTANITALTLVIDGAPEVVTFEPHEWITALVRDV